MPVLHTLVVISTIRRSRREDVRLVIRVGVMIVFIKPEDWKHVFSARDDLVCSRISIFKSPPHTSFRLFTLT